MKFFWRQGIFSCIMILKMGVKMNLRIITKNHTADSKIRSPKKSISEPSGLTSSTRQLGSLTLYNFEFDEMRRELRNAPLRRSKLLSYIKLKNRLLAFENFFIESGTAGFFCEVAFVFSSHFEYE